MEDGTAGALLFLAMQTRIATQPHMHIVRLLDSMKKIGLILLAGFCLSLAPAHLAAQSSDPSEAFLKAYMTSQQGEKLEHDNQFQPALAKFRFAGALLEELKKTHADWQPAILDFRSRKIGESILRVQGKLGTQYDSVAKEKEDLNGRLQETNSKLEKAQADLEKTKGAETEARRQLAQAEESLKKISETAGSSKAQEALRAEIAQLKTALATAEAGRAAAQTEKA